MSYIFKHYARVEPVSDTGVHFVAYRIPIYNITYNLTNLESDSTNPTTIGENESATIIITAPTGYNLPSDITVTGCTYTWEASTGMLDISNATRDIEISAEGVAETYPVTLNLTNVTGDVTNPTTVSYGGSAIFKFTADANYELPDGITQTGALSYNWNKSTGQLVLARIQGAVTITIVGESTLTQLATPTNVTVDGTTVSWDAVENATSYDIYVDGVLYENTTGGVVITETWVLKPADEMTGSIDTVTVNFTSNNQQFVSIRQSAKGDLFYGIPNSDEETVLILGAWQNEAYRTIVFDEPVTSDVLLTWLTNYGTKQ